MKRGHFIKSLATIGALGLTSMTLSDLKKLADLLPKTAKLPVLFVGHGNPMNAILDNEISRTWRRIGADLRPRYILCISAHWESNGTFITGEIRPKTIHDFGGFPQALFDAQYPVVGSPQLAQTIKQLIAEPEIHLTDQWGLDHGSWSILLQMFPNADVPTLQLSLDRTLSPQQMYDFAAQLQPLRQKGVLIIGSGNIVHNLRYANLSEANPKPYEWAEEFDLLSKKLIDQRNHQSLINFRTLGKAADMSIPTDEHYLPLLYALALQGKSENVTYFNETMAFGSGSMRSFIIS